MSEDLVKTLREIRKSWPVIKEIIMFFYDLLPPEYRTDFKQNLSNNGNKPKSDPYAVLGVSPADSTEKIRQVYRRLAKIYHPDNQDTGNAEMFRRITEAYKRIMDERGE